MAEFSGKIYLKRSEKKCDRPTKRRKILLEMKEKYFRYAHFFIVGFVVAFVVAFAASNELKW